MTPVILLTGFLGSGKTTLLQRLLRDPALENTAVLVNEFGEVGLDHHLLDRIDENVVLLKSGCICCTVRGEVADALSNLHSMRTRGELDFDRVVIETTGLADPYPVLQTLTAHPVLRSHFSNGGVMTMVDAVNAEMQVAHRAEAVRQIAAADRILLTKTDLAPEGAEVALRQRLLRINPAATVLTSMDPVARIMRDFGPAVLDGTQALAHVGSQEAACAAGKCDHDEHHHHHHSHAHDADETHDHYDHHSHAHHHHAQDTHSHHDEALGVTSFFLQIDDGIDWTMFGTWLTLLLYHYGDRIFRVKGILAIEGEDRPVAIHGVQHLVHAPTHMENWPVGANGQPLRQSRLVFILEGIEPERIRRSFEAFMGTDRVRAVA
ncbi:CobW family GTP-binding protein [Celeribacter sp.]|uniref:CobW family GTP-binding protein n=1 Tax=Celeribacter sp. TaxID=1890673 RepID=UPI003A924528